MEKKKKIAVLGLGYVGLPLAVSLSSSFKVIGFDISLNRVSQLSKGIDSTLEISKDKLSLTNQIADEILSLPIGPQMESQQASFVCNVICNTK